MKKLFLAIAALSIWFTPSVEASDIKLGKKICEQIKVPEWISPTTPEEVQVKLSVSDEGVITIKEVKCKDEKMKKYITDQLNGKKIKDMNENVKEDLNLKIVFEYVE